MRTPKFSLSLFIFRRDLRLTDNQGLTQAVAASDRVIPCFIIDPRQVSNKNKYKSNHALLFMKNTLKSLAKMIKAQKGMLFFFGETFLHISPIIFHTYWENHA